MSRPALMLLVALSACTSGEDSSGSDSAPGDSSAPDSGTPDSGTPDSGDSADSGTPDSGDSGDTTETDDPGTAKVRFFGKMNEYTRNRVAFSVTFDGEPISAGFDAGVLGAEHGWFYPGDNSVEVPAGDHIVAASATFLVYPPCPNCPPQERSNTLEQTLTLADGDEVIVMIETYPLGIQGPPPYLAAWTVEDDRVRAGNGGVRLIGGAPLHPDAGDPLSSLLYTAFDNCIRAPGSATLPGISVLLPTPADDTAEAWVGTELVSQFGPQPIYWGKLPNRPAGGVLPVFTGNRLAVPPAAEGAVIALENQGMNWANCPEGPS